GDLMPIGMSMNCLLSAAAQLPLVGDLVSDVVPLDYVSPGPLTVADEPTTWPSSQPTSASVKVTSVTSLPSPITVGSRGLSRWTGSAWAGLILTGGVWFAKGAVRVKTAPLTLGVLGTAPASIRSEVTASPGTWRVKVAVKPLGGSFTWSAGDVPLKVGLPTT